MPAPSASARAAPAPLLPVYLTTIMIVSAAAVGANATEEDFNGGRAAIGTGPYRWVRFTPGSDVTLERAPRHWGAAGTLGARGVPLHPERQRARLRAAGRRCRRDRCGAAGAVRARARRTAIAPAYRDIGLQPLHLHRQRARPFALRHRRGWPAAGSQPAARPARAPGAVATPSTAPRWPSARWKAARRPPARSRRRASWAMCPTCPSRPSTPPRARALLAEAGYPNGFGLTIHCTSDRFAGDAAPARRSARC